MKIKSYSERKKLRIPQLIKESPDYVDTVKELESDFEKVKKVVKGSSITAFEVWLELGVKAGVIKEKDAQKLLDKQNESAGSDEVDGLIDQFAALLDKPKDKPEIERNIRPSMNEAGGEEGGEGGGDQISPEAEEALTKEIEAALKTVINDLPKELKTLADGGELELTGQFDKEAEQELNEALGALIAGGALALPALTQILGKTVKWAGGKLGSGDVKEWGEAIEHIGHDLHHKYEGILDKILSPVTKNMSPDKRALTNKLIFYSIVAVLGGAGIAGAAKAAGAGQAGLAAVEGGLSGVKASELVAAARQVIPRVLGNMVQAA